MKLERYQIDMLLAAGSSAVFFLISAWIFLAIVRRRMADRQEVRRAILEKLSGDELLRLVESDGGRDVLAGRDDTRAGIERGLQLLFASIGAGIAAALFSLRPLGAIALIGAAAGAGQLVASLVLARRGR